MYWIVSGSVECYTDPCFDYSSPEVRAGHAHCFNGKGSGLRTGESEESLGGKSELKGRRAERRAISSNRSMVQHCLPFFFHPDIPP